MSRTEDDFFHGSSPRSGRPSLPWIIGIATTTALVLGCAVTGWMLVHNETDHDDVAVEDDTGETVADLAETPPEPPSLPYSIDPTYIGTCNEGLKGATIGVQDPEGKAWAVRVCHATLTLKVINGVNAAVDAEGNVLVHENDNWIGQAVNATATNPYIGPNGIVAFRL